MTNPETRRALRNLAVIALTFVLLWFVWEWAKRLDPEDLLIVTILGQLIIAIFAVSVGFENGLRALKLSAGRDGINIEAGGEE